MTISGIRSGASPFSRPATSLKAASRFDQVLSSASSAVAQPTIQTVTANDGTAWTTTNIDASLTDADKQILGWSTSGNDSATGMLAALVASDRNDGTLKGGITADYILGNQAKNIAGLVDREPGSIMTQARLGQMMDG